MRFVSQDPSRLGVSCARAYTCPSRSSRPTRPVRARVEPGSSVYVYGGRPSRAQPRDGTNLFAVQVSADPVCTMTTVTHNPLSYFTYLFRHSLTYSLATREARISSARASCSSLLEGCLLSRSRQVSSFYIGACTDIPAFPSRRVRDTHLLYPGQYCSLPQQHLLVVFIFLSE